MPQPAHPCPAEGQGISPMDVVISPGFLARIPVADCPLRLTLRSGASLKKTHQDVPSHLLVFSWTDPASERGDPQLQSGAPKPRSLLHLWVLLLPKDLQQLQTHQASPTAAEIRLYYRISSYRLPCLIACCLQGHTASLLQLSPALFPVSSG